MAPYMKQYLLLVIVSCLATPLFAQYVYTINADSVKITNHCDTAELIIENHTQTVPGFLFNKGRGRTEFRRGLFTIDDTLYLIGEDTLNLANGLKGLYAENGLQKIGNTIQFGNDDANPYYPADQRRNTYYYQGGTLFNWMTGPNLFTFSKYQYSSAPETNALRNYYLARFYSPQGGILMEGNVNPGYNGPLAWINFKNDHPAAATYSFFGDPVSAGINCLAVQGTDSKIYHHFQFTLPNDSPRVNQGTVFRLYPTHVFPFGAVKIPTATATRLSVEDNISGCTNCIGPLNANNPYSSLVVDARNNPVVMGNLPANPNGRMLIIDGNGRIWKGDTVISAGTMSGVLNSSLAVNGDIKAKRLRLSPAEWPDYVFENTYRRPSLPELEQYIKQNKHLPEIPAAADVAKNGIDVGDNQAALLKKIEELTLYLIEQGRELQALKQEMAGLKKTTKN